jgi:hypothetical protein
MSNHDDHPLTPAERELESAFARLAPAAPARDLQNTIAFEAGRRAARRSVRVWQTASATLLLVLFAVATVDMVRVVPGPDHVVDRIVYLPTTPSSGRTAVLPPSPSSETVHPVTSSSYLAYRDRALVGGVDSLPAPAGGSSDGVRPTRASDVPPAIRG